MRVVVSLLLAAVAAPLLLPGQGRDLRLTQAARRALVIGNNDYRNVPTLANAVNDAEDLGARLTALGFEVTVAKDADLRGFNEAVDRFVASIEPGDVALFHFSGHGLQHDQENYLIPTDFQLRDAASLRYDAYSATRVHDRLTGAGAGLAILLLDACRSNGFQSARAAGGLAAMSPAQGSFIAFATGPGSIADDNPDGRNGLFTAKLLETLDEPGLDMLEVFQRVREGVVSGSGGRQTPWTISSVLGRFYFNGAPASAEADPREAIEISYWSSVAHSDDPRRVQSYLDRYPDGAFAELARVKLRDLELETTPEGPQPGEVRVNPKDGAEYVWVPAGALRMGCAEGDTLCDGDEKPARAVEITEGFWMGRTEVTVGQYKKAAAAQLRPMPLPAYFVPFLHPGLNPGWKWEDHPMVQLRWEDADWYCREGAGGRLPSEAEWEYAARAGGGSVYAHGDVLTHEDANYGRDETCCKPAVEGRDQWKHTAPVGAFAPNAWGLFDMTGNVWEWTRDWYDPHLLEGAAERDPRGPESGTKRTVRGGAWDSTAKQARISDRQGQEPGKVTPFYGARCVVVALGE